MKPTGLPVAHCSRACAMNAIGRSWGPPQSEGTDAMSITRTYRTEAECARCWIHEDFDDIPERLVLNQVDACEHFEFFGIDCETEEYGRVDAPMWGTYFTPNTRLDADWIEANAREIANLGFTVIYEDGELFGLGIDGAGYDFYEAHWIPLYRLRGFRWHDEGAA